MEVVGSKRLTSPKWVTTGVGPDTRVATRKLTHMAGWYDIGKLPERFPWFYRTFWHYTSNWKRLLLQRLFRGEFLTVYPTSGAYRNRNYQVNRWTNLTTTYEGAILENQHCQKALIPIHKLHKLSEGSKLRPKTNTHRAAGSLNVDNNMKSFQLNFFLQW